MKRKAPDDLRDWFAGQAIAGLARQDEPDAFHESAGEPQTAEERADDLAIAAYLLADAMMRRRDV